MKRGFIIILLVLLLFSIAQTGCNEDKSKNKEEDAEILITNDSIDYRLYLIEESE